MSQRIPPSFIQDLLARTDVVEIIQSRVSLIKRGDNYVARCPFHEEKTPSFSVSHRKQFYYCFGCNAHGNAIGFLMAFDQMGFREAVAALAARLGLEIPSDRSADETHQHAILYDILETAARYYQSILFKNHEAIAYLKSRGVSGEAVKQFGIGYAPAGWQSLQNHVGNSPEKQAALIASGLVISASEAGQRPYDRFRERITFPIRNAQGKMIGFGARTLGNAQPKYLNSPETPIFHKGGELYGLYEARQAAKLTQLVVVEGYMDVIALHQQGIRCAVATLGTAVTPHQIQKLLRQTEHIVFCFDGDNAGRHAAWKALITALPLLREGIHIRFLFLPEKEDPDSLIRKIGTQAFQALIEKSVPLPDAFFNELRRQIPLTSSADKAHFGQKATQWLNTMPPGLFRQLMYEQLARELQMDAPALTALLQPAAPVAATKRAPAAPHPARRLLPPAHLALSLLLHQPELALSVSDLNRLQPIDTPDKKLLLDIMNILRKQSSLHIGELLAQFEDEETQQRIASLAARELHLSPDAMKEEFLGALANIEEQAVKQDIETLIGKAKKAPLTEEEKGKLQNLLAKIKKRVA